MLINSVCKKSSLPYAKNKSSDYKQPFMQSVIFLNQGISSTREDAEEVDNQILGLSKGTRQNSQFSLNYLPLSSDYFGIINGRL